MGTAPQTPPMADVPSTADIILSGEAQELAQNMTQVERDALLIHVYRNTQEIVGFVRDAASAMAAMQSAPGLMGTMMRGLGGTNGGG